MKFRCWWLGAVLEIGQIRKYVPRLTVGFYIWDGFSWAKWELHCYDMGAGTWCPGGTVNLAFGPFRAVYVRWHETYKTFEQ